MLDRRQLLTQLSLGTGSALLAPALSRIRAEAAGAPLPKRVVFVVRANGLRPWGLAAEGLEQYGDSRHRQELYVEESLTGRKLHETFSELESLKNRVTIIQGLSGRSGAVSDPHGANFGALGCYRSDNGAPPAAETIDGALAKAMPAIFSHVGLKMGKANELIAHPALSAAGKGKRLPFYCSPIMAYQELFGSLATDNKLKAAAQLDRHLLDFMVADVKRVKQRLPAAEKEKLEHYLGGLEAMRDRQVKLAKLDDSIRVHIPSVTDKYTSPIETHRLEAHFDLAAAALIAGLTNVVTIDADDLDGRYSGLGLGEKSIHEIGHLSDDYKEGRDTNFADGTDGVGARNIVRRFQVGLIAGLAQKLAAVPEGDGNMLDNTLIVYFRDAGQQHHANYENFPMVLVGNLGRKFKTGRFLHYPSYHCDGNRTLGSFYTTILHAVGHPRDGFGQVDLQLPEKSQKEVLAELFA